MATRAGLPSVPSGLWPSLGDARVKAVISLAGDAYPFTSAGHMLFGDPCENLPWTRNFSYRDGFCTDAVWGTRPLDIVKHYTTAFLRDTLNADPKARATLARQQPHLDNVEYNTTNQP